MVCHINIATGIFEKFNDSEGIMICGYEWGESNDETTTQGAVPDSLDMDAQVVFSNKIPRYGAVAAKWPYDRNIIEWFQLWGHPLRKDGLGGDFEKCIVQTNWCNSQNSNMTGVNYWTKLLAADQVENFIRHVDKFRPKLILLFGSQMINILQNEKVLGPFTNVMGPIQEPLTILTKPFDGRKFKVGLQAFENCQVVSLPHPSSSRGLSKAYIRLFAAEIGERICEIKRLKKLSD